MYIVSVGCRLSAVYCAVSSGVRAQRKSKAHLPACLSTCPMSICLPAHLSTCIFALPCIAITIASQSQTTGGEERPSLRPSFHSVYKFFEKFPGTPLHARSPTREHHVSQQRQQIISESEIGRIPRRQTPKDRSEAVPHKRPAARTLSSVSVRSRDERGGNRIGLGRRLSSQSYLRLRLRLSVRLCIWASERLRAICSFAH